MRMQRKWCRSLKAWKSLVVTLSCMLVTTKYKSSESYSGTCVLVVGCGSFSSLNSFWLASYEITMLANNTK
jgi:hypothetical protein